MQLTRRTLLAASVASAALSLTGCGKDSGEDALERILKAGEITIATEGTWAPWTYHDDAGVLTGFDIEVGRLIAAYVGVQPKFIEGKWDGLLAGVSSGRFDIMINGVDLTAERQKAYRFSEPYAFNRTVVITRENDKRVQHLEDLKDLTTANTISSTYAEIAEKYGAKVTGVDDLNQTIELLLSERIDATLNGEVVFADYKRVHPNAEIRVAAVAPDVIGVAIPMKNTPDTARLKQRIDEAIEALRKDGSLGKLSEKYFGVDITHK